MHTPTPRTPEECPKARQRIRKDQARIHPCRCPGPYPQKISSADYFQGVGGCGALPFFHGVGGCGALPFFHGVGGCGALPFAMITEPSPWVTTTVFRLIAPTRTSMARNTTVSLRDIVPPRFSTTPVAVYILARQCQVAQAMSLYRIDTHLPVPSFR